MSMSPEELRKEATRRVKAKKSFWQMLGIFVIVSLILTAVWALSGGGYYWPVWAMFGMGIAAAFAAWGAYGPNQGITESQIDDEMRKLQGGG